MTKRDDAAGAFFRQLVQFFQLPANVAIDRV